MKLMAQHRVLIGVDVQSVDEVESSVREYGSRYLSRVFTTRELATCDGDPQTFASSLAARFAAKEAVNKLLDRGDEAAEWRSIEVLRSPNGHPKLVLHDPVSLTANQRVAGEITLSLSHTGDVAVATAAALAPRRKRRS